MERTEGENLLVKQTPEKPPVLSRKTIEMSSGQRVAAARAAAMKRDRELASKMKTTFSRIPASKKGGK